MICLAIRQFGHAALVARNRRVGGFKTDSKTHPRRTRRSRSTTKHRCTSRLFAPFVEPFFFLARGIVSLVEPRLFPSYALCHGAHAAQPARGVMWSPDPIVAMPPTSLAWDLSKCSRTQLPGTCGPSGTRRSHKQIWLMTYPIIGYTGQIVAEMLCQPLLMQRVTG